MNANAAFNTIVETSGLKKVEISKLIGKHPNQVSAMITNKNLPRTDTFANIANVCGWDLLARNRTTGEEIVIDPE